MDILSVSERRLASELDETLGVLSVEQVAPGAFRVLLPLGPLGHDSLLISVESVEGGWVVSDAGMTRFLVEDDLEELEEALICAGAPFRLEGDQLIARVTRSEDLAEAVRSFGHYLAATPIVWQALECARVSVPGKETPTSAMILMAREARADLLDRLGPKVEPVIHLNYMVFGKANQASAPLAIASPRGPNVRLIASFIDMTARKVAITAAQRATSFLLDVVAERDISKFVVVRGDEWHIDRLMELYTHERAEIVSTEQKGSFVAAARKASATLIAGTSG